jgi:hypothetical protein
MIGRLAKQQCQIYLGKNSQVELFAILKSASRDSVASQQHSPIEWLIPASMDSRLLELLAAVFQK